MPGNQFYIDSGYVQWAGITADITHSFYDFYAHDYEIESYTFGGSDQPTTLFGYTAKVSGFSASASVEDPTVPWDETASPYVKVATIRIPIQSFESDEQMQFGENLSFTPWHALAEHRPLGGINRARLKVYEAISARRHELNGVAHREPTAGRNEKKP